MNNTNNNLFTFIRKITKFNYEKIKLFPVPSIYFIQSQIVDLQNLGLNLITYVNNPIDLVSDEDLLILNTEIIKRFNFNVKYLAIENITEFINFIRIKFLFLENKKLLDEIKVYLSFKYSPEIVYELTNFEANPNINLITKNINYRVKMLSNKLKSFNKLDFFELFYFKLIILHLSNNAFENLKDKLEFLNKETYQEYKLGYSRKPKSISIDFLKKKELPAWNFITIFNSLDLIINSCMDLDKKYSNCEILYLARDGFIFYETSSILFPNKSKNYHNIYISRETLNSENLGNENGDIVLFKNPDFFQILKDNLLNPAILKCGILDVNLLIKEIKNQIQYQIENNQNFKVFIHEFTVNLYNYIKERLSKEVIIFFDSSSKTFPILLCSFCQLMFPEKSFLPYFAITEYNDPSAGYLINQKDNFSLDLLPEIVSFHKKNSTILPYNPQFKYNGVKSVATNFLTHLILYYKLSK